MADTKSKLIQVNPLAIRGRRRGIRRAFELAVHEGRANSREPSTSPTTPYLKEVS